MPTLMSHSKGGGAFKQYNSAAQQPRNVAPHMNDDSLVQKALLFRGHDEVVSVVLVVHDVLQVDACKSERDRRTDTDQSGYTLPSGNMADARGDLIKIGCRWGEKTV